jgi:hypothetical protein
MSLINKRARSALNFFINDSFFKIAGKTKNEIDHGWRWSTSITTMKKRREGELLMKEYHDPQRDATRREREREYKFKLYQRDIIPVLPNVRERRPRSGTATALTSPHSSLPSPHH